MLEVNKMTMQEVSCSVRIPAEKRVTAIHLLAEQVEACCWFKKVQFIPIMIIKLDRGRRQKISTTEYEYPDCRVTVDLERISELDVDSFVRMKVKMGEKTIRKKMVDAKYLIECLKNQIHLFGKIHITLEVSSFYPLTVALKIETKKDQGPEDGPVITKGEAATEAPVQGIVETTGNEPLPAAQEENDCESVKAVAEAITGDNSVEAMVEKTVDESVLGVVEEADDECVQAVAQANDDEPVEAEAQANDDEPLEAVVEETDDESLQAMAQTNDDESVEVMEMVASKEPLQVVAVASEGESVQAMVKANIGHPSQSVMEEINQYISQGSAASASEEDS